MIRTVLAGAFALGLTVSATTAEAQQRQRFEYWYGLTGQLGEVMEQHCRRFNESQTRYEAVCVGQGGYDRAEQNTIAAFRARQHPTLVQIYDAGTVNFMLSGVTYNAVQFARDFDMRLNWADYFPGISAYYATSRGDMWSFPYNSSTAVMYWNREAWRSIGRNEPPATWEQMERDMRALRAAGHACPHTYDFDTWQSVEQMSAIHGEPIATRNNGYDGLDAELLVNRGLIPRHLGNLQRWTGEGLARVNTAQTGRTIIQAFADGTCASMLSSIANHGVVGQTAREGLDWGVAMIPLYEGYQRRNSLVGGASLWVLQGKSREEYQAAAAFLDFVLTPAEVKWMPRVTGYIPITRPAFREMQQEGFYAAPPYAGREIAMQSLTATEPTPVTRGIRLGNFTSIRAEIRSEWEAAASGRKTIQQALDDATIRSNQVLRRFEQTMRGRQLP
ncbi:extracellular solute-binding protein [Roseomonas sp. CCTCC AB2023176]|uniref:extracellular solute-binding protein n=1 Tax=Roseomonas sp. CCTCC AB2023176 TaxID=3342640 RepID=UPI0035DFF006